MREILANYVHELWIRWMTYLLLNSHLEKDGTLIIPAWLVKKWKRQMNTVYDDLPTVEKKSDQAIADGILTEIIAHVQIK